MYIYLWVIPSGSSPGLKSTIASHREKRYTGVYSVYRVKRRTHMSPRVYTQRGLQPGMLKQCPKCKRYLTLDLEFWKRGRSSAGFRAYCRPCDAQNEAKYRRRGGNPSADWKIKLEMLQVYGGCCVCCGEQEPVFLTFDHIKGGGSQHRRDVPQARKNIARWLQTCQNPNDFQVLCFNCHKAKDAGPRHLFGKCPHELKSLDP